MSHTMRRRLFSGLDQAFLGALVLLAVLLLALAAVQPVHAAELIPQVGYTHSLDGSGKSTTAYGLAIRTSLMPMLQAEIAGSYRKQDQMPGSTDLVQWPVTASLWARPVPAIYAGGGLGWYSTTLEYAGTPLPNTTTRKVGAHVGGGFDVPLAPHLASLDIGARYVYLGDQTSTMPPRSWKADFWTATAGLAVHF